MNDRAGTDSQAEPAPTPSHWMPALVLGLGLASLLMLVATNHIHERVIYRDQSRLDAVEEIQLALTAVHLWLEEYLTGDRTEIGQVDTQLARADNLIRALLEGDPTPDTGLAVRPLVDGALRSQAGEIRTGIEAFKVISARRQFGFDQGEAVGVGTAMDELYDQAFRGLLREARGLKSALTSRQIRNRARALLLFEAMLGSWVVIIALSVFGLWSHDRRRARAEQELRASQAQLLQSQKMDAVGRLAGGISHDINNYLGAIRAQSELVQMRAASDRQLTTRMSSIIRVVDKASSLIEQLLGFSRKQPTRLQAVDLNRLLEEGVGKMARGLVGEAVRFETRLEPQLWPVKIDPAQIEQVLVNLLVNARQAMPDGGSVTIATDNREIDDRAARSAGLSAPGAYVVLTVSDTGTGIPEEIREKIFEPFFTTQPTATSSGLGLSMVYGLIEQNHGAIRVHSRPGEGATFAIYLPRGRQPLPRASAEPQPLVEPTDAGRTILLVEDNDEMRHSLRAMIEALGCEVIAAGGGDEAIRLFEEVADDIDLVISDVVMPGINGPQLVGRLRQRRDGLKVLYISGNTGDAADKATLVGGETAFLKKPFGAKALLGKIRELTEEA